MEIVVSWRVSRERLLLGACALLSTALQPYARVLEAAEREPQPGPGAARSGLRPEARIHRALAGRDDRADRSLRRGPGSHLDLRPVRPQVQGPRRPAERNARHRADDA